MDVRESTERQYYENYQAIPKKTSFQVVTMSHSQILFMINIHNCNGKVVDELPCNYYMVEYIDETSKPKLYTIHGSLLAVLVMNPHVHQ